MKKYNLGKEWFYFLTLIVLQLIWRSPLAIKAILGNGPNHKSNLFKGNVCVWERGGGNTYLQWFLLFSNLILGQKTISKKP